MEKKSDKTDSIRQIATKERNRLKRILNDAGVSDKRIKLLEPVIHNTAWMKAELDVSRNAIGDEPIVVEWNNGEKQKGIHENPLVKAYENLWRSYMQGMAKIIEALPEEVAAVEVEEAEKPKTVLELVRAKHKAEA